MKGRAHLEWHKLLQLNKCGWMIISFPPRNKRKRRRHRWIITLSKTIKSDFEVVAPPNLSNTSAAEMTFWAQPTGAAGPLRLGPRGSGPAHSCVAQCCCCRVAVCDPTHGALQHSGWVRSQPRGVPWPPRIKTSWAQVRSRNTRARTSFVTEHCVNKHTKVVGCHRLTLHVVLLFSENIECTSALSYRLCSGVHFTAEEPLTGQFSSWAEIQCSSPSPRGAQEHSCMPNRIHPDCSRLGAADISWLVRYYWSKQTLKTHFTIFNQQKMLRQALVSSNNYILQLLEIIVWLFIVHLFIIVSLSVSFCKSSSIEALLSKTPVTHHK